MQTIELPWQRTTSAGKPKAGNVTAAPPLARFRPDCRIETEIGEIETVSRPKRGEEREAHHALRSDADSF